MKRDIISMRDREIFRLYKKTLEEGCCRDNRDAAMRIISSPSPCFWIQPRTAEAFISRMLKGISPKNAGSNRKRMHMELYSRYIASKGKYRNLTEACEQLVQTPAPEFYIGVDTAIKIIKNQRDRTSCRRH